MTLPDDLIAAVTEGRAVLFLGAGASHGARSGETEIPMAADLGQILAKKFLRSDMKDENFSVIYDLCCSARDTLAVQEFIAEVIEPFQPAGHHLLLPRLPWHGIVTTNYDLVVERAYEANGHRLAELVPIRDDTDPIEGNVGGGKVPYVKLHGCITKAKIVNPPLIASTEQLIDYHNGRRGQFEIFLEWAKRKTVIFVGYRFADPNLRNLFQRIIADGDNRPNHYLVTRSVPPEAVRYWSNRRVEVIQSTAKTFYEALSSSVSVTAAQLSGLMVAQRRSTFTRFVDRPGAVEGPALLEYLGRRIEHLTNETVVQDADARSFYRGTNQGWAPIKANLDVRRGLVQDLLRDEIIPKRLSEGPRLVVVTGHAGAGKTVSLRRVAWEACNSYDRLVLFVSREHSIDLDRLAELSEITSHEIFLFVDNIEEHRKPIERLMSETRFAKTRLRVIGASNTSFWTTICQALHPLIDEEYEVRYLSTEEIDDLLGKLKVHGSLGYLAEKPIEFQRNELQNVYGRQLLVALLEATNGKDLIEIVANEYLNIEPVEARRMYATVCSLHRFGPPVRAGLISRLHDIGFEDFSERFFRPLAQIVRLRKDGKSGDLVYEARHSHIAQVVYEAVFKSDNDRFDNIVSLITHLNPSYSYDEEVLFQLIRANNVRETILSKEKARQIYDVAGEVLRGAAHVSHQRAVYEMDVASSQIDLDTADRYIDAALQAEPYNRSFSHTRAEILLKRSRLASDPLERESWRRQAISVASELTVGSKSSYPFHTILKARVDRIRDLTSSVAAGRDPPFSELNEAIADAEGSFKTALQKFPNDAILVGEEGNLQTVLSEAGRAEDAFRRAFDLNPRSALLSRRLAMVKRARGDYGGAISVLQKGIQQNGGDASLHFEAARTLMMTSPGADLEQSEAILHHLRRAYNSGAKDHQVKFWYARQLALAGDSSTAERLFSELAALQVPFEDKTELRGVVRNSAGSEKEYTGVVVVARETYALVQDDVLKMRVFAPGAELKEIVAREGMRLSYFLGFNLRGAVAVKIHLLH